MVYLGNVRGRATAKLESIPLPKEANQRKGIQIKLIKFIHNLRSSFSRESVKKTKVSFPTKFPAFKVPKIFLQGRFNRNLVRQFTLKPRILYPTIKVRTFLEKEALESNSLKHAREKKLRKDKQESFDKILMSMRRWELMQGIAKNYYL